MDYPNTLPLAVAHCCRTLWQAGFEAYPVGGCVRDLLLARTPQDWDICTSALPPQVQSLFPHTVPTGIDYGTVTVVLDGQGLEVTTFRCEGGYRDGRRPDAVSFVSSLTDDLSRRDFTVNAMALAPDGTVIDPFGGQADLEGRVIRCVGAPMQRFQEDRLRMFRAIRFAAQLNFTLAPELVHALEELGLQPHHLPAERIRPEVEKTLCAPAPHWAGLLFSSGLLSGPEIDTSPLTRLSCEPLPRWAGLASLMAESGHDPLPLLQSLIRDKKLIAPLSRALVLFQEGLPQDASGWRHALARYGIPACEAGAAMAQVQGHKAPTELLDQVLAQQPCLSAKELALSGRELAAMGLSGRDIGRVQGMLLDHVLDHPEDNTPDKLRLLLST
ncbi:tRNA nucleotidyltransferase [Pseudoflavonifractor capillosus]|uniref:CCA tRNA nucleotidyltransferase n=1 Tax=Pseudoflavonifractor capillosus TaxID=106588 RepID=UPI00195A2537|nr:tRNA nucleotidyltransferase [Pseudoflavonifractor capillosus]MBM6694595.1 tRNA nucleotidyltransferase [Pseudoflavonifractor capillosus]